MYARKQKLLLCVLCAWTCLFSLYTVCTLILRRVGVNMTQKTPERRHRSHIDPACHALLNEWMNERMNTSSWNQQWLAAQQPLLEPPLQLTLASFHHKTNHAPPPLLLSWSRRQSGSTLQASASVVHMVAAQGDELEQIYRRNSHFQADLI
jgi:hypothetical protein